VKSGNNNKGRMAIAGTAAAVALGLSPVILPAFASGNVAALSSSANILLDQFTPAGVDSRLAEKFAARQSAAAARAQSRDFQFTPAGLSGNQKTLTVAARSIGLKNARAVSAREVSPLSNVGRGESKLKKTEFRLTSADLTAGRGWKGFSVVEDKRAAVNAPLISDLGKSSFRLDKGPKKKPSRFKSDIAVAKERKIAPSVQGNAAPDDYQLDVGGSFSISRKIDVTAGVRYKSERDQVAAAAADNSRDSEAVYIGTKIRF